jgi:hypothetical protein
VCAIIEYIMAKYNPKKIEEKWPAFVKNYGLAKQEK